MAGTTPFTIGTEVCCTDGLCGKVSRVVVDPVARTLTHLVVESGHHHMDDRLVPLDRVEGSTPGQIRLRCTLAEYERLDPAVETDYVPNTAEFPGYAADQVYTQPFFGLSGTMARQRVPKTASYDKVPLGEVDVRRGQPVHATDGEVGKVQGLVIDAGNYHVTHVLLQEGHLWGHREVAIPISAVTGIDEEGMKLSLTKHEVADLPAVDIDHPGS